jgi:hypothetical protein
MFKFIARCIKAIRTISEKISGDNTIYKPVDPFFSKLNADFHSKFIDGKNIYLLDRLRGDFGNIRLQNLTVKELEALVIKEAFEHLVVPTTIELGNSQTYIIQNILLDRLERVKKELGYIYYKDFLIDLHRKSWFVDLSGDIVYKDAFPKKIMENIYNERKNYVKACIMDEINEKSKLSFWHTPIKDLPIFLIWSNFCSKNFFFFIPSARKIEIAVAFAEIVEDWDAKMVYKDRHFRTALVFFLITWPYCIVWILKEVTYALAGEKYLNYLTPTERLILIVFKHKRIVKLAAEYWFHCFSFVFAFIIFYFGILGVFFFNWF